MADYYVSPSGNDAQSGTIYQPFLTVAHAIAAANAGDSVQLRSGTYAERVVINKPLTLKRYGGEIVLLQAPTGVQTEAVLVQNTHDVVIDGLTVDAINRLKGISISQSYNVAIQHNEVKNCYGHNVGERGQGIIVSPDGICHDISILNNEIHHIGGVPSEYGFCHAIYASVPNTLVRGNSLHHVDGNGVHFIGDDVGTLLAEQNYVHDTVIGIGVYNGIGKVFNNVIRDVIVALQARYGLAHVYFFFNTCYNAVLALDIAAISPIAIVEALNNVLAHGDKAVAVVISAGTAILDHNLRSEMTNPDTLVTTGAVLIYSSIDTTFLPITDDGAANIKPSTGNPAIGKAIMHSYVSDDYGSFERPNPPTIGAWERAATTNNCGCMTTARFI